MAVARQHRRSTTYADDVTSYLARSCLSASRRSCRAALRNRARLNRALHEKAERAERERAARGGARALDERTRIAGELHDVVAHALSAMTVQAAARAPLAERDPAQRRGAFAAVETTGREALAELRRLLGVLRREDEELGAGAAAEPRARQRARRAAPARPACPSSCASRASPPPLPAGVDLTAYR